MPWRKPEFSVIYFHFYDDVIKCSHTHSVYFTLKTSLNLQAPCVLYIGQAFRYSPENAFYIFNLQIYFII